MNLESSTPALTEAEIIAFLDSKEHDNLWNLFDGFLADGCATEEELMHARAYAYYAIKWAKDNKLCETPYNELLYKWGQEKNVAAVKSFDEIDLLIHAGELELKDGIYYITIEDVTWELNSVNWISSANELYELIKSSHESFKNIVKVMGEDSPSWKQRFESRTNKAIKIVLSDSKNGHNFDEKGNECIWVAYDFEIPYYYTEHIMGNLSVSKDAWIKNGVKEYYGRVLVKGQKRWDESLEEGLENGNIDALAPKTEEERVAAEKWQQYYKLIREKLPDEENKSLCAFIASGMLDLEYIDRPEIIEQYVTYRTNELNVVAGHLGNGLSHPATAIVCAGLVNDFGADTLLNFRGTFNGIYGMSSDEYVRKFVDEQRYLNIDMFLP